MENNNEENKVLESTVSTGVETPVTPTVAETPVVEAPVAPVVAEAPVAPTAVSAGEENKIIESAVSGIESESSISQGQADINNQTVNPEPVTEEKKKSKLPIIIVCVLLVCCLGVGAYFFLAGGKPYESAISSVFKALNNSKFFGDAYKLTANVSMEYKGEETEETKLLKEFSLKMETEVDKDMNSYGKFSLVKGSTSILDFVTFFKDNKIYFGADKLTDKIFFEDLSTIMSSQEFKYDKSDIDHLLGKLEEGLKEAFKDEKSTKEDKKLTINGKEVTVKNNYYVVNSENAKRIVTNFVNVFNNAETIKVLAKITNAKEDEVKKGLDSVKDLKDEDFKGAGEGKLCIYTKGLFNENVGFAVESNNIEFVSYVRDGDYSLLKISAAGTGEITVETKDKVTEAKIVANNKTLASLKATSIDDNNSNVVINIMDEVIITADIKYESIKSINTLDTSKAIKFEDMTDEDSREMEEKLQKIFEDAGLGSLVNSLDNTTISDVGYGEKYQYINDIDGSENLLDGDNLLDKAKSLEEAVNAINE